MSKGTVTVFGGSGFLGRYVVRRLANLGWTIRVAVRRPSRAAFLQPLGDVGQITPLACDVRDAAQGQRALAGSQAVVNLVGILYEEGRQSFAAVQYQGAKTVATAAAALGITQFVQISALGVSPQSSSDYSRSKAAAEQAVLAAIPQARIVRPSIIFGAEDDFFNRFAGLARLSPFLPLIGGGHSCFQPVYVGDVADGIVTALDSAASAGQIYELGGPEVATFKELMQLLLLQIRRKRLLLPLPFALASFQAWFLEKLPHPLLTRDQVKLLKQDNVVSGDYPGFEDLGLQPTTMQTILPTYLDRYRPGGKRQP